MIDFQIEEKFYRAVLPPEEIGMFWKGDKLSSAAFRDSKGLSVDRQEKRTNDECIKHLRQSNKRGPIYSIKYQDCLNVDALVVSKPTKNIYHCEIHGSKNKLPLSGSQAKRLARVAKKETS